MELKLVNHEIKMSILKFLYIGVASTKAYIAQIIVLTQFALMIAEDRYSKRKRFIEVHIC